MSPDALAASDPLRDEADAELVAVVRALSVADPTGERVAAVFRSTFDQLYDGQHTGRFRWDQLYKTEKTHFGTLFEINLRRELRDVVDDGALLDYQIAESEVDCKYSQRMGGWMIPPEARGHLLLVAHANDEASEWALGVVRASDDHLRQSVNRDGKTGLNPKGNAAIRWIQRPGELPPNVLLQCAPEEIEAVFAGRSGQQRVNELFRRTMNQRIGRNAIATVAQQDDYMKRVRANGGARSALKPEGYVILGGDYLIQRELARALGLVVPQPGEMVSSRVVPAAEDDPNTVELEGRAWRVASDDELVSTPAPDIPSR